jgi:hypothetical protein
MKSNLTRYNYSVGAPRTLGPEGGLFTRSGSAADPFLAEQLSAMPSSKTNLWEEPRQFGESS